MQRCLHQPISKHVGKSSQPWRSTRSVRQLKYCQTDYAPCDVRTAIGLTFAVCRAFTFTFHRESLIPKQGYIFVLEVQNWRVDSHASWRTHQSPAVKIQPLLKRRAATKAPVRNVRQEHACQTSNTQKVTQTQSSDHSFQTPVARGQTRSQVSDMKGSQSQTGERVSDVKCKR